jgi:ATP phosphoribosyltransferase
VSGPLLRMAMPSKGRLAEPAARLLRDAGVGFEPNGRTLFAHCQHVDLELLFARSDDIPIWTADGAVDLAIAGENQVREAGVDLDVLLRLGFGICRLTLAVPAESAVREPHDLAGRRVATSYPRSAGAYFDRLGVEVTFVELGGSVELAPRLRAADAVVDLVSTGETLRRNGLRELETILRSEAVLLARRDLDPDRRARVDDLSLVLGSVLAARPKRYLMLNAPDEHLDEVLSVLPGLDAPTVLPLSRAGMHAVHAVIDADDVVRLLGPLKTAGASSLLVIPIEHLIP